MGGHEPSGWKNGEIEDDGIGGMYGQNYTAFMHLAMENGF